MIQYNIPENISLDQKYKNKALEYYRDLIKSEVFNIHAPVPPRNDEGIDKVQSSTKTWWNKSKDSFISFVTFGGNQLGKIKPNGETLDKIKTTGVNALCGLRQVTCTTAMSAFANHSENYEPNYVKMEEIPNTDNNRR